MAADIIQEQYNGIAALYANAGQWVTGTVDLQNLYAKGSQQSNQFTIVGNELTRQSGNWGDDGFVPGMTITIKFFDYNLPPPSNPVTTVKTITYINGNQMYIDTAFGSYPTATFPTTGSLSGMMITADESPEAVEFFFNLTENGIQSINSIIDQQVNKLIYDSVNTMAVTDIEPMIQENLESGGLIKDITITRNADTLIPLGSLGDGTARNYTIDFKFFQWGLLQDGFNPPAWYDANDCLAPSIIMRTFGLAGNPNSMMEAQNGNNDGNTGYFDENFNGGLSNYQFVSIDWTDLLGGIIEKLDYSNFSDFEAIIDAPNQDTVNSNYRIGLAWLPIDTNEYQTKPTNLGENLMVNAPDQDFQHSGAPAAGPWLGFENEDGVKFDLSNLQFEQIGGDQVRINGRITPNAAALNFFNQLSDGERRMVIWIQVGDYTKVDQFSDQVNLLIYDDDNYDAPTIGVQYPKVVDQFLYDHAGIDITSAAFPNTTTEDDVLYTSRLLLDKGLVYDGINTRIFARNSSTGEEFTLESLFFGFQSVPYIAGIHEMNLVSNRGFNLPTGTDRNIISITRDNTLDTITEYGVKIDYGFLNRWEYWQELTTVSDDFFDAAEPNNGKNRDWQRFSESGDWSLQMAYYVRLDDVDDYQEYKFKDRPYEDDPNVTTVVTFTRDDGSNPTNLVQDELIEIDVKFLWNNTFFDEWAMIRLEDFEGATLGTISTEYDQVNQPNNPLIPLTTETRLTKNNLGTTLECKCLIDTNLFDANTVSLSYRTFSRPKDEHVADGKQMAATGYTKYTTWGGVKQKA